MLPFHQKKKRPARNAAARRHRRAAALSFAIRQRQQQLARLLSQHFERLPLWARKGCLLTYCLLMAFASGWLLVQATWVDGSAKPKVLHRPLSQPMTDPGYGKGNATDSLSPSPSLHHSPTKSLQP